VHRRRNRLVRGFQEYPQKPPGEESFPLDGERENTDRGKRQKYVFDDRDVIL